MSRVFGGSSCRGHSHTSHRPHISTGILPIPKSLGRPQIGIRLVLSENLPPEPPRGIHHA